MAVKDRNRVPLSPLRPSEQRGPSLEVAPFNTTRESP